MTKKKDPKDLKKVGRKTVMTPEVLTKLEQAFSIGCPDDEACIYADISRMTLRRYQEKNPEFCERKELLKQKLVLKARTNIAHKIQEGDIEVSKWYAERKRKAEFSTRQELTGQDGRNLIPVIEIQPVKASKE